MRTKTFQCRVIGSGKDSPTEDGFAAVDCSVVVPVVAGCLGKRKVVGYLTASLVQIQTGIRDQFRIPVLLQVLF